MKNANDLIPAARRFLNAAWIFWRSSRFIMSLRMASDSDSMPIESIQHPDRSSRLTNSRSTRLSARALASHRMSRFRAISSSQNWLNVFALSVTVSPQR